MKNMNNKLWIIKIKKRQNKKKNNKMRNNKMKIINNNNKMLKWKKILMKMTKFKN